MRATVMPPERWCWLAERARLNIGPGFGAVEVLEDLKGAEGPRRVHAACGFDGWTPNSVSMHVALDVPAALRHLVRQCFGMAFDELKREVVTVTVLSSNTRSLRLVQHLGFHHVFTGRDYWAKGVDLTVWEMRRRDCRYLDNPRAKTGETAMMEAA